LFQGNKRERKLNKINKLPFNPAELDAIILTHGHLDHFGYLPVLVKKGFTGPIYATSPSRDISEIILRDSARIQVEGAREANKKRSESKKPLKPLYREKHVDQTMPLFKTYPDNAWVKVDEEVRFRFQKSGHILGSATVELELEGRRFVFSGDVGQREPLILDALTPITETDYLVMESTYGDKLHDKSMSPYQALEDVVNRIFEKGGSLIIPSFAVERAQEIILILNNLMDEKSIPAIPIYLDSPLETDITKIFQEHRNWHNLSEAECDGLTKNVHIAQRFEETLTVLDIDGPKQKVVIAGSGMATGGRVLYYLKQLVGDSKNTVLLVGHQATGTHGHQMSNGAKEIEIDDETYQVQAEISQIGSLSAHGDQGDLLWWLGHLEKTPKQIFLNHGEKEATEALKKKIEGIYDCIVTVAEMDAVYDL
jgi:metallo-beta-lactamase family protein